MADPFKLRVLRAITDTLKQITPANGYSFNLADTVDMGPRVVRGRAWFGESDPLPLVSVLEADEADMGEVPLNRPLMNYRWPLLVQGFVVDDRENPTDPAYRLMADVRRCLALQWARKAPGTNMPDPFGLGLAGPNTITALSFGPGVVRPADDISANAYFWLRLDLDVSENAADPYS